MSQNVVAISPNRIWESFDLFLEIGYRLIKFVLRCQFTSPYAVSASHCFIVQAWQTSRLVISPHSLQLFTSDFES